MALKLLKVLITLEVKGDRNDVESTRDQIYDTLNMLMETEELDYSIDEENEEDLEDES